MVTAAHDEGVSLMGIVDTDSGRSSTRRGKGRNAFSLGHVSNSNGTKQPHPNGGL